MQSTRKKNSGCVVDSHQRLFKAYISSCKLISFLPPPNRPPQPHVLNIYFSRDGNKNAFYKQDVNLIWNMCTASVLQWNELYSNIWLSRKTKLLSVISIAWMARRLTVWTSEWVGGMCVWRSHWACMSMWAGKWVNEWVKKWMDKMMGASVREVSERVSRSFTALLASLAQ